MDFEYLISTDNGKSVKGPFPLDQIKSMYLNNRLPVDTLVQQAGAVGWTALKAIDPALADQRVASHSLINAAIEDSEKEAIREERSAIWKGLIAFVAGSVITVFTYKVAAESPSGGRYIRSIAVLCG